MVKRLKKLRQSRGISQQMLADGVGVSQQSINKYENHNVEPDLRTLAALADYFATSIDYLVGHSEVDHVIEVLSPHDLNAEESELIEKWRQLNSKQKASILSVIDNYQI